MFTAINVNEGTWYNKEITFSSFVECKLIQKIHILYHLVVPRFHKINICVQLAMIILIIE